MGKGARERKRRRSTDHLRVSIRDESTLRPVEPSLSYEERLALMSVLTRSANRRGVVTGVVAVSKGQIKNLDDISEAIKDQPPAHVYVLETKEEES